MTKKAQKIQPSFDELISSNDSDLVYTVTKTVKDTGLKFSIVAIFLSLLPILNILGVFLASKGYEQSRYEGHRATAGLIAIFLNAISLTICIAIPLIILYTLATSPYDVCVEMGSGKWLYDGQEFLCQ